MRTPAEIAADARSQINNASRAFVPVNVLTLVETTVEFMESTAATLATLAPAPAPAPAPITES